MSVLFLLLPVAALSGWYIGRRESGNTVENERRDVSPAYLKGLNFLLNEQPDKAIDVFIQLLEVDSETIETHLALGSLFRRRGEVDRAIRIHQNLIARPTLNKEQRSEALFELGQDYLRAGLLDRAEALFSELISSNPHTEPALRYLIDIYQQEKDWDKAIEMARRLEVKTGMQQYSNIAHFYCEQAEQARHNNEFSRALKLVKRALNTDRSSVRASILEGNLELETQNYKTALKAFKRIEQQDINFLPEIIPQLMKCYRQMDKIEEMTGYLQQITEHHNGVSIILALTDLLKEQQGDELAVEFLTDSLRKRPTVRGMDRLIAMNLLHSSEAVRDKLQVLKDVTEKMLAGKPIYKCHGCGFSSKQLYWQCPGCRTWDSIKPIHGVEGE
ncbi:MAG: lipopolysaccharide assembly protein LapB [Gammaproteobacteria bacterium]|nr:lipopolysaccharide assembly protein LapB [Gammaproteobacteria bacterium]MDH5652093.1 lipopolysaccharide assembly protein LapB [Gammaproteobacteria bacterium]